MKLQTFFIPLSAEDYHRFMNGVDIGTRRHTSRPHDLTPIFSTEQEAINAYTGHLNNVKSFRRKFVVLRFRINRKHQNIVEKGSELFWNSSLNHRFFVGETFYEKRRSLAEFLRALAVSM